MAVASAASEPTDRPRLRASARRRARAGRRLAGAVWKNPFRSLPADRPLARFLRGLLLPLGLMRASWRSPELRRGWLKVCALQALVVLAIALPIGIPATMHDVSEWTRTTGDGTGTLKIDVTGLTIIVVLAWVEWGVIALSRQFHDQIGRRASLAIGVPPEDEERHARVQVDLRWAWNKGRRRWRSFKAWAIGLPAIVVWGLIPGIGGVVVQVMLAGWTLFWFACGAAAKTAYAWRSEDAPGASEPFFLRLAIELKDRVPLFGWWAPRAYLFLWRRDTGALYPPIREVEARGWEFAGLAVARVLMGLPVMYLFARPFFPVAAADLVLRDLASPRGAGARTAELPALPGWKAIDGLVVSAASPEAEAVVKHRDDKDD